MSLLHIGISEVYGYIPSNGDRYMTPFESFIAYEVECDAMRSVEEFKDRVVTIDFSK
jgi:hypothetical protein